MLIVVSHQSDRSSVGVHFSVHSNALTFFYCFTLLFRVSTFRRGLIELSFEMAGGYDPKMKSFGNGGDGDAFTMSLVIFSSLLSLIMWGTCSKCADKYSDFSQQKKADKLKSKNPYSDRGKQVKPISTLISTIFCTCGQVAVPEDGIDLQQMDKRVQAQMLTPPPAPASEEEYNKGMSQLKEWKKEEEFEASHTITKMLKEEAIKLEHQLEDGVKHGECLFVLYMLDVDIQYHVKFVWWY